MAALATVDGPAFAATRQPARSSQPDNAANCSYAVSGSDIAYQPDTAKATSSPSQIGMHAQRPPGTHEKVPRAMSAAVTAAAMNTYGIRRSQPPTGPSGPQCAWRLDHSSARPPPARTIPAFSRNLPAEELPSFT